MHSDKIPEGFKRVVVPTFSQTLSDFKEAIREFGSDKILMEMDEETFWALFKWFHKSDD